MEVSSDENWIILYVHMQYRRRSEKFYKIMFSFGQICGCLQLSMTCNIIGLGILTIGAFLACSLMLQMRYLCPRLLHIIICFCWNHSLMKSPRSVRYSLLPRKGCVVIMRCSEVVFKFFLIFAKWISTINLPYPPGMCNAPHLGVKFNQIKSSGKMKHSCCYICKINFNVFF